MVLEKIIDHQKQVKQDINFPLFCNGNKVETIVHQMTICQ